MNLHPDAPQLPLDSRLAGPLQCLRDRARSLRQHGLDRTPDLEPELLKRNGFVLRGEDGCCHGPWAAAQHDGPAYVSDREASGPGQGVDDERLKCPLAELA